MVGVFFFFFCSMIIIIKVCWQMLRVGWWGCVCVYVHVLLTSWVAPAVLPY